MTGFVLAIDQGTTSSRAIVFDGDMKVAGVGQKEFAQHYPASGWVEHDPEEIWSSVVSTCKEALKEAGRAAADIAALGITNQRETVVVWDRKTGELRSSQGDPTPRQFRQLTRRASTDLSAAASWGGTTRWAASWPALRPTSR